MDKILKYMMAEDEGFGDITSNAVVKADKIINAQIKSKDTGIFAGGEIVSELFKHYDVEVKFKRDEADKISVGDKLMSLKGYAKDILLVERTALNLLMRMSGVATAANHYCNLVKEYNVKIAGTRKTMPAIAKFDKYALNVGGADTHRLRLDDMVLIKENHIATCKSPLDALIKAKKNTSFSKKIEIEVETIDDAVECVKHSADIVMLDNMNLNEVSEVLDKLNELKIRNNSLIEVSGGINEKNVTDYAKLGVDIISIGAITHASRSLDFSLKVLKDF